MTLPSDGSVAEAMTLANATVLRYADRKIMSRRRCAAFSVNLTVVPLVLFVVLSCAGDSVNEYYLVGERDLQRENRRLLTLLDEAENPERAIVLRRLAGNLRAAGHSARMRHLLSTHVSRNPDDPYNGYYLFLIGRDFQRSDETRFARRYFRRALHDYPDVELNGSRVHFATLEALIAITEDPRERIDYYEKIVERFPSKVDGSKMSYYMGRTWENLVNWDQSREAYEQFLAGPATEIPGASDAEARIQQKLDFADSSRSWTFEDLGELVDIITVALRNRDTNTLNRHQSGVNFFAASPQQDPTDANSTFGFDIGVFLSRSNVQVANEFSVHSNNREAYLQTTGWAERFSTWYFYFRRVDFPADPEVHGNWEWAGIRFGEVN